MANVLEDRERHVIPNWRSFGKTTILGELNSLETENSTPIVDFAIDEYIIDFELNKTLVYASELLSAAIINNKLDNKYILQASKFILDRKEQATPSQVLLAEKMITASLHKDRLELSVLDKKLSGFSSKSFYQQIKDLKQLLNKYPHNAILLVELSRCYSNIGEEKKSIQSMKIAMHLANDNRFVLRSATRLFAHFHTEENENLDYIQKVLAKNSLTKYDPWLMSAEISISTMMEKNSKFIKKGIDLINSKNISPFNITELSSSIATVELINGSHKKSRKLFKEALIDPNGNSLAQIEWASTKDKQILIEASKFDVKTNFEALALKNYSENKYNDALSNTIDWFTDQPFSIQSVIFGSNLASTVVQNQQKSIELLKAGLVSHPNHPTLINNLAYALALDNKPNEALVEINKVKSSKIDETTKICLKATKGLALFRLGSAMEGRKLYLESIQESKDNNYQNLNWTAILNYVREEINVGTDDLDGIMDIVTNKIPKNSTDIGIKVLRSDVIKMYKSHKNKDSFTISDDNGSKIITFTKPLD